MKSMEIILLTLVITIGVNFIVNKLLKREITKSIREYEENFDKQLQNLKQELDNQMQELYEEMDKYYSSFIR